MSTTFKGHKTGFKPGKSNSCCPNESGPPATKFGGRSAMPAGPLKRYPGGAAAIDNGNRRLAKSTVGADGDAGVVFRSRTGFSK